MMSYSLLWTLVGCSSGLEVRPTLAACDEADCLSLTCEVEATGWSGRRGALVLGLWRGQERFGMAKFDLVSAQPGKPVQSDTRFTLLGHPGSWRTDTDGAVAPDCARGACLSHQGVDYVGECAFTEDRR